jgi:hypothetical protein
MSDDYEATVRAMAMARWPREYLALHGWKAFEGVIDLMWQGEPRSNVHDIWLAMRHIHPQPTAFMHAAAVPPLWGAGNLHLHPNYQERP